MENSEKIYNLIYKPESDELFVQKCFEEKPPKSIIILSGLTFERGFKIMENKKKWRYYLVFNEERQVFHQDLAHKKYSPNGYKIISKRSCDFLQSRFARKIEKMFLCKGKKISTKKVKELWEFFITTTD